MPSAAAAYANTAVSGYGGRSATGRVVIAASGDCNSATRRNRARRRSFLATGGSAQELDANSKWNITIDGGSTFGPLSAATAPALAFDHAAPVSREAGGGAASGSGSNPLRRRWRTRHGHKGRRDERAPIEPDGARRWRDMSSARTEEQRCPPF